MSEISARFVWEADALHLLDEIGPVGDLEVADSFLVRDGAALAVDLHRDRFVRSALEAGSDEVETIMRFWAASLAVIPHEAAWFPRFELARNASGRRLSLLLRSAPSLSDSVVLATYGGADVRSVPRIKGPDLEALMGIRDQAVDRGADEAVLLHRGLVVDGSTSAILWWRGDTLCTPPAELDRVESITAASILTIAAALDVDVVREPVTPNELAGTDVWAVNSLHGIRSAIGWFDGPAIQPNRQKAMQWRRRLSALARPVAGI